MIHQLHIVLTLALIVVIFAFGYVWLEQKGDE